MLSEKQLETLQALVDRIIPPDDYPGAWDAGVGDYILWQLQGDFQGRQSDYATGLDSLEAEAQEQYRASFGALSAEQQDALLRQLETGTVQTHWPLAPNPFFQMVINHTAEGYYGDPGNGGNRQQVSWQMIGFAVHA